MRALVWLAVGRGVELGDVARAARVTWVYAALLSHHAFLLPSPF